MNIGINIKNRDEIGTVFFSMKNLELSVMSIMSKIFKNRHNKSKIASVIATFKNRNMDTMDNMDRHTIFPEETYDVYLLQIRDKNKDRISKNKDKLKSFKNKKSQKKKSYLSIFGLSFTRSTE